MARHSRFVLHRPHRWHIQEDGKGRTLLLLHGAGGATQSWRGLFPLLAQHHHVIAIDLPGQGFSQSGARHRLGLRPMAEDLAGLIAAEGWDIDAIIGHSAGVALALQLAMIGGLDRTKIVGINGALSTFKGVAGFMFPVMAKVLSATPFTADLFAATASSPQSVARLIANTGSTLPAGDLAFYQRLVKDRSHVDGTLAMMAQWDLEPLLANLPKLQMPTLLLAGQNDRAVPPDTSRNAAAQMPNASVELIPKLGHLMHEEDPDLIHEKIKAFL
jgi:magnesium chelatase accessory protein